ncbi:MAG TPA: hypothetical protein H9999_03645 [Candidatus Negativibacillus faecipullorum]|nr:hypothetical protein [Candidatus Negativibacillus faecipullorum]
MTYKQDPMTDIPVSSLTYAIKGQRLLEQNGYTAWAGRDHDRVTGCGYKLTIRGGEDKAEMARALLMQNGIRLARRSQAGEEGGGR